MSASARYPIRTRGYVWSGPTKNEFIAYIDQVGASSTTPDWGTAEYHRHTIPGPLLPENLFVGLGVTSHDDARTTGAVFSDLKFNVGTFVPATPRNLAVPEGYRASFTVTINEVAVFPPAIFQWTRDGVAIPGANAPTYTIDHTTPADESAQFAVVVSNREGAVTSSIATLSFRDPIFNNPEGFEPGWGDWYAENGVWEVGELTVGPGAGYSSTNCVGTVLGGNYPYGTDSRLVSPRIDLPLVGAEESIRLRFWHTHSYRSSDKRVVQVTALTDGGWSDWQNLFSVTGSSSDWSRVSINLTEFSGTRIRLGFLHDDNHEHAGFWGDRHYESTGWYVADVEIKSGPDLFNNPESFEASWGDWDTDNYALWQIGRPTVGPPVNGDGERAFSYARCAATLLGGNYSANSDGRLITPSFAVPSVNPGDLVVFRFWQWYEYGAGDEGTVEISVRAGTDWFPWETIALVATNGITADWEQQVVDLTPPPLSSSPEL